VPVEDVETEQVVEQGVLAHQQCGIGVRSVVVEEAEQNASRIF
jgi:hypothetical protein